MLQCRRVVTALATAGAVNAVAAPAALAQGLQIQVLSTRADYQLTRNYFENPSGWGAGVAWTPAQIAAVQGHPNYANSVELSTLYWPTLVDQVVVPGVGEVCQSPLLQTRFATPRMVADESVATDQKCRLKPLRESDYYPITFSAAEWAQVRQIYPNGVCDWSKPGVDQWPRSPGRPTRTPRAAWSTAARRWGPRRPGPAAAGPVLRFTTG